MALPATRFLHTRLLSTFSVAIFVISFKIILARKNLISISIKHYCINDCINLPNWVIKTLELCIFIFAFVNVYRQFGVNQKCSGELFEVQNSTKMVIILLFIIGRFKEIHIM